MAALDEARGIGQAILNLLHLHDEKLDKIVHNTSPPAKKLGKLDVLSNVQLRSFHVEPAAVTQLMVTPAGTYTKLNHWAALMAAAGTIRLFTGVDAAHLNILDNAAAGQFASINPYELVIPPNTAIWAEASLAAEITLALTLYELTL